MEGIPAEDLQRHRNGLPLISYKRIRVADGGLLPLLAAQKSSVPEGPDLQVYSPLPISPVLPSVPVSVSSGPVIAAPAVVSPPLQAQYIPYPGPQPGMNGGMIGKTGSHSGSLSDMSTNTESASTGNVSYASVVLSGAFDNIVIPPSLDINGKNVPGSIIIFPDLTVSVVLWHDNPG
jgi:hypothetical protein